MKYFSALCILALIGLTACTPGAQSDAKKTLTVFAAASLTEVFDEVASAFNESTPDVEVKFSFAGSADLVSQISEGAPADVIATADEKTMTTLQDEGLLTGDPEIFAGNTLALAVAAGNPKGLSSSQDLAGHDLVVCAPQVPCGAATRKWSEQTGVSLAPVSEENSVTDVLGKVSTGQADAGIVYVTDIRRADGDVEQIDLDGADEVVNLYPAGVVKDSADQEAAEAFVRFLRSDAAVTILRDAGFTTP